MHTKSKINKFAVEMTALMAETCKIGKNNQNFVVLTMQHSLAMKNIDIKKRTLAKWLHGGDALRLSPSIITKNRGCVQNTKVCAKYCVVHHSEFYGRAPMYDSRVWDGWTVQVRSW